MAPSHTRFKMAVLASAVAALGLNVAHAAILTPGDLLVYRMGDGTTALTSTSSSIYLCEYTPTGSLVQTITVGATAAGVNLTSASSSAADGYFSISSDGSTIVIPGYNTPVGTTTVATSTAVAVPRAAGKYAITTNFNTTGATPLDAVQTLGSAFNGTNIRSVASPDGNIFYVSGNNASGSTNLTTSGIFRSSFDGSVATTQITQAVATQSNDKVLQIGPSIIANSPANTNSVPTLYTGSNNANPPYLTQVSTVGTSGLPTSTTALAALTSPTSSAFTSTGPGIPPGSQATYSYYFADLSTDVPGNDTLYLASDNSTNAGVLKYCLDFNGTAFEWVYKGVISKVKLSSSLGGVRGLTGATTLVSGVPTVTLYGDAAGNASAQGNSIFSIVDNTGFDAVDANNSNSTASATALAALTPTWIVSGLTSGSAPTSTTTTSALNTGLAYRGIAIVPTAVPEPASLALLGLGAMGLLARRRR